MRFGHVCLFVATGLFTINSVNGFFSYISSFTEGIRSFACKYVECCNKDWTETDFNALAWTLTQNVYGQQIANEVVVSALKGHLRQSSPRSKALTLSFHGRPGVGKNYVATFIQNSLFDKGYKSRYAHFFSGRLHFPLESEVDIYKLNLIRWIQGNVSQCEYSAFVFDEVDKIPPKVLDAVKPFIDYHEEIYGVDFRKSIFIFLSNTGGDAIAEKYMQLWESGKKREELKLRDFEDMIRIGAFNEKGGFYKSETIESSLIDHYIPFLPLEERHVRLCIHNEFNKRGYHPKENEVKEIMDDLGFGPPHQPILSNAGCKRIAQKVVAHIENKIHWEL